MKKEAVRTVSTIPVAPTTLYYAWLNPEQHAAMTDGGAAKIDGQVGSKYSSHEGKISGKLMVLDLGRRMVVSWRNAEFPREAPDSRVEIHLEALGASTRITVLHTDIPEGLGEKVKSFWNDGYFDPMRRYFSKYLPDPRLPPPPRPPMPPMDDSDDDEDDETPKKLSKLAAYRKAREKGPSVVKAPASKAALPTKGEKAPAKPEKAPAKPAKAAKPEPAPAPKPAAKPAPKLAPKAAAKPAPKAATKKPAPKKPAPKPVAKKKPAAKKPAPKKPAPKKKKK